jgi:hypothetical protein
MRESFFFDRSGTLLSPTAETPSLSLASRLPGWDLFRTSHSWGQECPRSVLNLVPPAKDFVS